MCVHVSDVIYIIGKRNSMFVVKLTKKKKENSKKISKLKRQDKINMKINEKKNL